MQPLQVSLRNFKVKRFKKLYSDLEISMLSQRWVSPWEALSLIHIGYMRRSVPGKEGHDFIHILRKCSKQLSSKLNILTPGMKVILSYDFLLEVFCNILESRTYYVTDIDR